MKGRVFVGPLEEFGRGEKVDAGLLHSLGDQKRYTDDDDGGAEGELGSRLHGYPRGLECTRKITNRALPLTGRRKGFIL